jgi:predicted nucleotidyltransferase
MPKPLDQLVEKFRKALNTHIVSIVLYGSAAVGDRDEQFSDYNVLCVLDELNPDRLRAAEPIVRWWREQGNPAPLMLTEHEFQSSTDCFAIEFHDIKENHRILFGRDVVSNVVFDDSFYRAQVEYELRAKLLRLRQKASGILSDKEVLRRLLVDSVSTFCVLFRHALILHGVSVPARKRDVVERAKERFGIDGAPFDKLLALREKATGAKQIEPEELFRSYMKEIAAVIDAVDRLEK